MRIFPAMTAGVVLAIFAVAWLLLAPAVVAWSKRQSSAGTINLGPSSTQTLSLYAPLGNGDCVAVFVAWSTKTPTQLMGISDGTNTYTILDTSIDG